MNVLVYCRDVIFQEISRLQEILVFRTFCPALKNRKAHFLRKFQSISGNFDDTESHFWYWQCYICIVHIQILLTGYIGLIYEAVLQIESTIEWSERVRCRYCMHVTPVTVAAAYPHSSFSGTSTCSNFNGTASYETCVAGCRNLNV